MNEREPTNERHPRHRASPSLEQLGLVTSDDEVRNQWLEGLAIAGSAFVAYSLLETPKLHTSDALQDFRASYRGSYASWEAAVQQEAIDLGWEKALRRFRADQGIPEQVLQWDVGAFAAAMKDIYDAVEAEGEVHLFSR